MKNLTDDTFLLTVKLDNNEVLNSHAGQYGTLKVDELR
jgi:NAD(P)H-flavin reductase